MDGFSVSSHFTAADWKAFTRSYSRRTQGRGWRGAALMVGLPLAIWTFLYVLMRRVYWPMAGYWLSVGLVTGYGVALLYGLVLRSWSKPVAEGNFLGDWHYDFSPLGIRTRRKNVDAMTSWAAVREIAASGEHIFLWTDAISALLLPIRDLPAGMSSERAQAILRELRSQSATQPATVESGAVLAAAPLPPVSPGDSRQPRSVARSLGALARWLTWRTFDRQAFAAPDAAIGLLALSCVALLVGLDRLVLGPNAQFSWYEASGIATRALGLLLVGWVLWRATDPQPPWRAVVFILTALTLLAVPVRWAIGHIQSATPHTVASWALLIAQMAYLARALKVITGYRQHRAVACSLLALLVGGSLMAYYIRSGPLWYVPEDDSAYTRSTRQTESLLMTQPGRIHAAVSSMEPRSGDMSLFMVGFAGVGEQKVFAGEIALAAQVIGERYGTASRTLLLINDRRDLESHPLASMTGLKLALADVGRRMDRERDALILVISSHGSRAPEISVSNGDLPLADLTGQDLKEALDESGIRWRVIVISACHAGAFIPYLRDDHSIVITAAAADRTSFGCSDQRDLTNFGEAFIRDALPKAANLHEAFDTARAALEAAERAQGLKASMPTAYFGPAMESKLQTVEPTHPKPTN